MGNSVVFDLSLAFQRLTFATFAFSTSHKWHLACEIFSFDYRQTFYCGKPRVIVVIVINQSQCRPPSNTPTAEGCGPRGGNERALLVVKSLMSL